MANMNDFLSLYFRQLRFNDMPAETRARFEDFAKKNDFAGNMKNWAKDLLQHDPRNPSQLLFDAQGHIMENPLQDPLDPTVLSEDEAAKIFVEFRKVLRAMDANKDGFADNNDAKSFFNEYFGPNRMFGQVRVSGTAKAQINALKQILDQNPNLKILMERDNVIDKKDFSFDKLKKGIETQQYNSDAQFQARLKDVAEYLMYMAQENPSLQGTLSGIDLDAIVNGFDNDTVDPAKLTAFRTEMPSMLRRLHKQGKLKDAFANFGGEKITKHIDNAKEKVAYDNKESKDYVHPKLDDQLTPWQQLKRHVGDTYENNFEKFIKLRPDHKFYTEQAKLIMRAIDGARIKPSDGLDKILENADKIKQGLSLKSPSAGDHLDWMVKNLKDIKSQMPKAYNGAVKNGRQMRALVSELILRAVKDGKKEEAKTALEILSLHRYGVTTSNIMKTLSGKEGDVSIFSDGGLSWNKNEGVAFVTKALDKSIKYAFLGIGYTLTAAGNLIRRGGRKFNNKSKRIDPLRNRMNQELNAKRADLTHLNDMNRQQIADVNDTVTRGGTIRESDVQASRDAAQLRADAHLHKKGAVVKAKTKLERAAHQLGEKLQTQTQTRDNAAQQISAVQDQKRALKSEIKQMQQNVATLRAQLPTITDADDHAIMVQRIAAAENAIDAKKNQIDQIKNSAQTTVTGWRNARNDIDATQQKLDKANRLLAPKQAEIDNIDRDLRREQARVNMRDDHLAKFQDATDTVQMLNDQINKRDNELNNMNTDANAAFNELMGFWDYMVTGQNNYVGNKEKAQQRYDPIKAGEFAQYRAVHGY